MEDIVNQLIENVKSKIILKSKKRIFEDGYELDTNDLVEPQDPEEFTKIFLIEKILDIFNLNISGRNRKFKIPKKRERKVDYSVTSEKLNILIEAKPINASYWKLRDEKNPESAVSQIKDIFLLAEGQKQFNFGIATDGLKWIFINNEGIEIDSLDISENFDRIKAYMTYKKPIPKKRREQISKDFYEEYNDILHGTKKFSEENCFVNSIRNVDDEDAREEIAQLTINRLLFIKFLYERGLIRSIKRDWDVFEFIKQLQTYELNAKLKELFFKIMNNPKKERSIYDIDPHFSFFR